MRKSGSGGQVSRVAVLNGSYDNSYVDELLRVNPDILLTGDLKYHDALVLDHHGIYVMNAGHYRTESYSSGLSAC